LQKRSLHYKKQKKLKANTKKKHLFFVFSISFIMLNFVILGLYDIPITTSFEASFEAKIYLCMCGVFILKNNPSQTEIEKLLKKLVEVPFSFFFYRI
jgi:hypothetical protein